MPTQTPQPEHRLVCAWCSPPRPLDDRGPVQPGETISHGICREHQAELLAQISRRRPRLKEPAAVEKYPSELQHAKLPPADRADLEKARRESQLEELCLRLSEYDQRRP